MSTQYNYTKSTIPQPTPAITRLMEAAAAPAAALLVAVAAISAGVQTVTSSDHANSIVADAKESARKSALEFDYGMSINKEAPFDTWIGSQAQKIISNESTLKSTLKKTDDDYKLLKILNGPLRGAKVWVNDHGEIDDFNGSPAVQMPNGDRVHFKNGTPTPLGEGKILGYRRLVIEPVDEKMNSKEIYQLLQLHNVGGEPMVLRNSYEDTDLAKAMYSAYEVERRENMANREQEKYEMSAGRSYAKPGR